MKKRNALALILVAALMLTGFGYTPGSAAEAGSLFVESVEEFDDLEDDGLLRYLEASVYRETINALSSDEYFVNDVSAVYISSEYIEELDYNSKANVSLVILFRTSMKYSAMTALYSHSVTMAKPS